MNNVKDVNDLKWVSQEGFNLQEFYVRQNTQTIKERFFVGSFGQINSPMLKA